MKSEIFKLKKEKKYLFLGIIIILVVLCSQIMSVCSELETINSYFDILIDGGMILILYIGSLFFICFHLGHQFSTKRIHLEVMNGFTRKKIFFSKLFIVLVICLLFSWLMIGICIGLVGIMAIPVNNGFMVSKELFIRTGLLTFIFVRFYAFMIFVNFFVQQGVLSGVAIWLYNVVQMLPTMLEENSIVSTYHLKIFSGLFGWGQCLEIAIEPLCSGNICKVITTGMVEMLLIGIVSYLNFSRKELK